jgi:hypothetical protein
MVIESFSWFERHEDRCDLFLNSQVRIMPTISAILQTGISFNVGVNFDITTQQKG